MSWVGSPFDHPVLRAFVRFLAFVLPAVWFWRKIEPSDLDPYRVFTNWKTGVGVGVAVSAAWVIIHLTQSFEVPFTVHAWLNVIFLSPIAEEVLFRRVAIGYLETRVGIWKSVLISAVLFALMHFPWWFLSGEKEAAEIATLLATMFVYGIGFGALYQMTKSLWASLIPHSVNNFVAVSINV